jgi:hypothetical protein
LHPLGSIIVVIGTLRSPFGSLRDRFKLVLGVRSSCQVSGAGKRGDWDRLISQEREGPVSG